jgi:hypothetical protein
VNWIHVTAERSRRRAEISGKGFTTEEHPPHASLGVRRTLFPLYRPVKLSLDYGRCVQSEQRLTPARTKVEPYRPTIKTNMTYIEQFEAELREKLDGSEDTDRIVRWISEKVLESYCNGITAGQKGKQVIRKGESRRRGSFGKAE